MRVRKCVCMCVCVCLCVNASDAQGTTKLRGSIQVAVYRECF